MEMIFNNREVSKRIDEELEALAMVESQSVCRPSDFRGDLREFINTGGGQSGESLPWSKCDSTQKLRPGELSVWFGINGHGKSNLLGQVMLWRMRNQKVLIASLEMKPHQTLHRMISQYAGCMPAEQFAMDTLDKLDGKLWIYDQLDTVAANRILGLIHYAAKDLGVHHVVIDSLMKCGFGHDDFDAEKKFVDRLQWAAKTLNVHIHLVCHARKGKSENDILDKFDVKGGGFLTDIPDNLFIVQRNKRREEIQKRVDDGFAHELTQPERDALDQPGVWFNIAKNRHGSEEGMFGLYFHKQSGQYISDENKGPMPAPF